MAGGGLKWAKLTEQFTVVTMIFPEGLLTEGCRTTTCHACNRSVCSVIRVGATTRGQCLSADFSFFLCVCVCVCQCVAAPTNIGPQQTALAVKRTAASPDHGFAVRYDIMCPCKRNSRVNVDVLNTRRARMQS